MITVAWIWAALLSSTVTPVPEDSSPGNQIFCDDPHAPRLVGTLKS